MGNYACRRDGYLLGWQINVADMMFRGYTDEQICKELWDIDKDDKQKLTNAKQKLRKLRRNEKFQEYYRSIITEWTVHNVGKALTTLASQMDNSNGWLANKACNDILAQSKNFTGVDENTVVVKVEGMPELGTPDD